MGDPTIMGMSCRHHDAAVAVVRGRQILFAAHSERYSRVKNDAWLSQELIDDALRVAGRPDVIVFYERPLRTAARCIRAGQWRDLLVNGSPARYIGRFAGLQDVPVEHVGHHLAHACGGYFTSRFREAAVVVADGIGEWDTLTVWHARETTLKRVFTLRYPHSLGLFYSAFTERVGLKPNEEEFIMMGLAALGTPKYTELIRKEFLQNGAPPAFSLRRSVHRGIDDWRPDLVDRANIAASVQAITETYVLALMRWVAAQIPSRNLVYAGGIALNCAINDKIARLGCFDDIWIMPNPGDAGSSLGAALAYQGGWVDWGGPYLGHDIDRDLDAERAVQSLLAGQIVGVANGRAEFGPRALGNRSLLADPRPAVMKDRVNDIKRREAFRPFAPVVQAEHAHDYFDLPLDGTYYMQYAVPCRRPKDIPAVCHVDGTSRVQTVHSDENPGLHRILEQFRRETGCPVLLNTSLNIKGQPLVNTWGDAAEFSKLHDVLVV